MRTGAFSSLPLLFPVSPPSFARLNLSTMT
jgi:hypothetical protein